MNAEWHFTSAIASVASDYAIPLAMQDGACGFEHGGTLFSAEVDAEERVLVLSASICPAGLAEASAAARALLARSLELVGRRMSYAVDPDHGDVVLLRCVTIRDCDDGGLADILFAFMAAAADERVRLPAVLAGGEFETRAAPPPARGGLDWIRG